MEFNKTIAARQSVRKFTEAQITNEQLKAILEAANAAPACMGQYDHLHLTVVQKPEILACFLTRQAALKPVSNGHSMR